MYGICVKMCVHPVRPIFVVVVVVVILIISV